MEPTLRIVRDYNRSLAPPVRWLHVASAAVARALSGPWRWLSAPVRRWWTLPGLAGGILFAALLPFDGSISRAASGLNIGGDLRRELEAAQQYGAFGSVLVVGLIVWLLDRDRRRRLLDLAAAAALTGLAVTLLKGLIGRPRPKFDDPQYFLGPLGMYPLPARAGVRAAPELHHAWEFWSNISSDLWSLPSSHTAFAVVLSVFLGSLYPRLRPLVIPLAALVGVCRVLFIAHYPTDVVAGAAIGLALGGSAVHGSWGVRALEKVKVKSEK